MESPNHGPLSGTLISVILPAFNRAGWVARAVESVLAQTHGRVELLAVDDGSTDGTRRVLEGFGPRVRVLTQPHAGAEAARNLGLAHARGEFVAFIDSDDVWYADRLSRQLPLFRREEVGLVFGNAALVDYRRAPPVRLKRTFFDSVRPARGRVTEALARGCFVPFSSVLIRRELLAEAGGFTPGRVAADYLKWFELSVAWEFDYVEAPVFEYAIHPGGISHDLVETLEDRVEAFRELLARNTDEELDGVLRQILFNLGLSLRVARVRRGVRPGPAAKARAPFVLDATAGERLSWSLKFAREQLLTRGRRMVLEAASLLNGRNGRP
ncbi:MAG TPA: glycosyltransferase family 2 protein [Pyrinomonadaceae bacterium]|jgi:glycosyltransferase involved in cell wall biosynthesis